MIYYNFAFSMSITICLTLQMGLMKHYKPVFIRGPLVKTYTNFTPPLDIALLIKL